MAQWRDYPRGWNGIWQDVLMGGYWLYVLILPTNFHVVKDLLLAFFLGWLIVALVIRRPIGRKNPLILPLLLMIAVALLSTFVSSDRRYSIDAFRSEVLKHAILFFMTTSLVVTEERFRHTVVVLLVSCAMMSVVGIFGYMTGMKLQFGRVVSLNGSYTLLGFYYVLMIPIILCLILDGSASWGRWFLIVLMIISVITLGLTFSRGEWVGFVLALLALGVMRAMRRSWGILAVGVLGIVLLAAALYHYDDQRIRALYDLESLKADRSLVSRGPMWKSCILMIHDRPVLGWGYGRRIFKLTYEDPETDYAIAGAVPRADVHNVYLQEALETGIVGLVVFVYVMVSMLRHAWRNARGSRIVWHRLLALGFFCGMVGVLLCGLINHFYDDQVGQLLWVLGPLAAMSAPTAIEKESVP